MPIGVHPFNPLTSQSNQTLGLYATSNTTQGTSGTQDARGSVTILGAGGASVGVSNGSILVSAGAGGAGDGYNILAAGTQTAATTGTVLFANSNRITFGMSDSTRITASHNGLTTARASNDAIGLNTAQTNVTWIANSSGLSINAAGYAGTGTSATNATLTLNSNGLAISVAAPGAGGGAAITAGTQSVSTGTVVFSNSNSVTFGMSGSSRITASFSSETPAFSADASSTFQTLAFVEDFGGWKNNVGSIDLTNVALSAYAVSNTTQSSSGMINGSRFSVQGAGIASVGFSAGSLIISVPSGSGGLTNVNISLSPSSSSSISRAVRAALLQ